VRLSVVRERHARNLVVEAVHDDRLDDVQEDAWIGAELAGEHDVWGSRDGAHQDPVKAYHCGPPLASTLSDGLPNSAGDRRVDVSLVRDCGDEAGEARVLRNLLV